MNVTFARDPARAWCGRRLGPALKPFLALRSGADDLDDAAADFAAKAIATGLGLLMLILVPWIANAVARWYERPADAREVQLSVFRRYALFQFLWIYVNLISLSVEGLGKLLAKNPRDALELLASRIAEASGYFCSVLVIKTFFGLAWELARPWPLASKTLVRVLRRRRARLHPTNPFGDDDGDDEAPDPARYGWILPNVVVVACILFTFAVITPLLAPFALAYFGAAYVVYKHQLLYVFGPPAQLGGAFFPKLLQALLVALAAAQVVLFGFFLSAQDWGLASAVAPLPVVSQLVALSLRIGYHESLTGIPLNVARHVDNAHARRPARVDADAYAPPHGRRVAAGDAVARNPLLANLRVAHPPPPPPDDDEDGTLGTPRGTPTSGGTEMVGPPPTEV